MTAATEYPTNHIVTIVDQASGREVGILNVGTGTFFEVYREHELVGSVFPAPSTPTEWGFRALDGRGTFGFGTMEAAALCGPGWLGGFDYLKGA